IRSYFQELRAWCDSFPHLALRRRYGDSIDAQSLLRYFLPLRLRSVTGESVGSSNLLERSDSNLLIVIGPSGCGKSTLLRWLAAKSWDDFSAIGEDTQRIPIVIKLSSLAGATGTVSQQLSSAIDCLLEAALPDDFYTRWPRELERKWLFLLDALDEVPVD